MGQCPCVGRKKGTKLENEKESEHKPPQTANVSDLSSVKLNIKSEPKLESLVAKGGSDAKSNAQTFSYRELATATNNFRHESLLGEGGFGSVYKGKIESSGQVVAVKKLNQTGCQGDKEFLVEVLMLSLMRHHNLVNLVGYCAEGDQRLLVYEFMPLGSLEYHLHDLSPDMKPLDWNTRMKIAAGAAKGLNYLHNEADPPVIYRDLKSSNILLGEGYHPKLSDFGLAKFGPSEDKSHVSTRVMGTHGYCAPEYASTGKLTIKSDIYSFGVVLLELITGRRALDTRRGNGKHMIVDWARPMLREGRNFVELADPLLKGEFLESVLRKVLEVALMCIRDNAHSRPNMSDVVVALNYLASQQYDPNVVRGNHPASEGGKCISERDGQRNESTVDWKGPEDTPKRMLKKDQERELAVAEAKKWGEAWREKRKQKAHCDFNGEDR